MDKIKLLLMFLISFPKTLYFNFRIFPIHIAIKLPVAVSINVQIKKIYKNCIKIDENNIKLFMIKIGFGGSKAIRAQRGIIYMNPKQGGKIVFKGTAKFSEGVILYNNSGITTFGNNFSSNKNFFVSSDNSIIFGDNCLCGWDITIRDSDGHKIYPDKVKEKNVLIGNHVWICAKVDILKGNIIGDNCVIAYNSCLTGLKTENNKLIGGYPAKVIKEDINWEL